MKEVNNSSFKGSNILNNKKNIRRFFILDGCYSYPWDEFFIRTSWDVRSYKPTHLFSDAPRRCIRRTTTDCRPYRSSHAGCRVCRSGSSGLIGRLLRLRLSNYVSAYREDFTSGLELSYGLRLALKSIFERKKFIIWI